jgi:hypothetical protein
MNNRKQVERSRSRPVWVDNFLIRERVARWRARDRVKAWLRRLPRRVVMHACFAYMFLATLIFSSLLWEAYKHPDTALLTRPELGPSPLLKNPRLEPLRRKSIVAADLAKEHRMLEEIRADSAMERNLESLLKTRPGLADSIRQLELRLQQAEP